MSVSRPERGRGWQYLPVQVDQQVLTHPSLSMGARGLFAVVCALTNHPDDAQAVLDVLPSEEHELLVAELTKAGFAWRDGDDFVIGSSELTNAVDLTAVGPATVVLQNPGPSAAGWAYAVAEADLHLVKIGTSADVTKRLRVLQTSSPRQLRLLWSAPGGAALEAHLHATFAKRRVRGEWFNFAGANAVALIDRAVRSFGVGQ